MTPIIEVVPTPTALIERALAIVTHCIETAVADRQRCTLALAGGSTPKPLYAALAQTSLPWEQIHCFWGDERYVPADHPDSNQGMARQAWLDRVPMPPQNIHPMPTMAGDPALDAQTHEAELQQFFNVTTGQIPPFDLPQFDLPQFDLPQFDLPQFDLILLGTGDDGHTASLFPHTPALSVVDRWITVGNKDGQPRLTFTVPLINQARYVLFLTAGANKRPALEQIFSPDGSDSQYPARLIRPQGVLHWLLDEAAGSGLGNVARA